MDSKQAMKQACKQAGLKNVAESLGISPTALYNQINDSGKNDILQKFVDFTAACEDDTPIVWACEQLNGIFVKNPAIQVEAEKDNNNYIPSALKEFSDVIKVISEALKDNSISQMEAARIRKEWEELKIILETFVLRCEFGYNE
ncbi:MAG: phage regulatory CII family protein [Victivallaceae bacterium]